MSAKEILQPKAEAEIAFVLNADLTENNYTEADILAATDYVCAAIEIVGSRVENWNIRITDTVADNASASHFVLGDEKYAPTEVDMVNCKMSLNKNGNIVSEGSGAACMGSPVAAVVWLANIMSSLGTPLQKGDIILSGALGPMCAAEANNCFEATIDGFGKVSFSMID
jgi:2-keto-4-pentenoate hydratase